MENKNKINVFIHSELFVTKGIVPSRKRAL